MTEPSLLGIEANRYALRAVMTGELSKNLHALEAKPHESPPGGRLRTAPPPTTAFAPCRLAVRRMAQRAADAVGAVGSLRLLVAADPCARHRCRGNRLAATAAAAACPLLHLAASAAEE